MNPPDSMPPVSPSVALVPLLVALAFCCLVFAFMFWKIFTKAGRPGWASLIPIYNWYVLLKVSGKPGWWLILFFIPLVSFIMWIIMCLGLAEKFGKGAGFGVGLAFLSIIFFPILGFGGAQYQRPAA
jgi:hypothetical protein